MGLFDKYRNRKNVQKDGLPEKENKSIYDDLGIIEPFTLLIDGQFSLFVSELANDQNEILNENEKKAFEVLWNVACIDIDGFGNNIWNLKIGSFEIYNKEDVTVRFEKKSSLVKDKYGSDEGRANFIYTSKDGSFIINQNDRNKKAFLVYVSLNMSDRLQKALRYAEAEALNIDIENIVANTTDDKPKLLKK